MLSMSTDSAKESQANNRIDTAELQKDGMALLYWYCVRFLLNNVQSLEWAKVHYLLPRVYIYACLKGVYDTRSSGLLGTLPGYLMLG